jgi:hypothetical protein
MTGASDRASRGWWPSQYAGVYIRMRRSLSAAISEPRDRGAGETLNAVAAQAEAVTRVNHLLLLMVL